MKKVQHTAPARGLALIAVLWIVAALAIGVTGLTQSVRSETRTLIAQRQQLQARALGEAAIALAVRQLGQQPNRPPWQRLDQSYQGYDIAVEDPRYIKELATHHVGGYLKIAPEHTEEGPLSKMMKPGMGSYDRFKELFDTYSKQAGKEQYLIPYFISAHPGTRDEDMVNLALWLKQRRFRLDQVQNFYPSPLANSTTMYYTGKNPLSKIGYKSEEVVVPKGDKQRRLHKALLRYHDPKNWPLIRQALEDMGKKHLIGSRRDCLVPAPTLDEMREARRQNRNTRPALTKHTPIVHQRSNGNSSVKKPVKRKA